MTVKYRDLTPPERVRLLLGALARGDDTEQERVMLSAPRAVCGGVQHEVTDALDRLHAAGAAAALALTGPVECMELLAMLLAPAVALGDGEPPSISALSVARAVHRATSPLAALLHGAPPEAAEHCAGVDWSELDEPTATSLHHALGVAAVAAGDEVDEIHSALLVFARQRANASLRGITLWCETVGIEPGDFLNVWCADLLDRLDALGAVTAAAETQLTRTHNRLAEVVDQADSSTAANDGTSAVVTSAAHLDEDLAESLAAVFTRRFPTVDVPLNR